MNGNDRDDTRMAKLPLEVVLLIVENLVPGTTHHRPILPASHIITKTLLNLTLVSKAIHPTASRLLWQNCLRIESLKGLHCFREFISRESIVTGRMPCEAYGFTRLFLCPFSSPDRQSHGRQSPELQSPMSDSTNGEIEEEQSLRSFIVPSAPPSIPGLADVAIIEAVNDILITLAPVLKAIVVDMPLRSVRPEDDVTGVRKLLREGFEALVNVEELVSINDELYLDTKEDHSEPEVWTSWPNLRRLCLYNVFVEPDLWKNMLQCPQLEMAVLSRADSWQDISRENIKDQWFKALAETTATSIDDEIPYQGPGITIAFCDWSSELPSFDAITDSWEKLDPDNRIRIMTVPFDDHYDPAVTGHAAYYRYIPENWARNRALSGSLWDDVYTEGCLST